MHDSLALSGMIIRIILEELCRGGRGSSLNNHLAGQASIHLLKGTCSCENLRDESQGNNTATINRSVWGDISKERSPTREKGEMPDQDQLEWFSLTKQKRDESPTGRQVQTPAGDCSVFPGKAQERRQNPCPKKCSKCWPML